MWSTKLGSRRRGLLPWSFSMGWEPVLRSSSGAWLWFVLLQFPVAKTCGLSKLLETPAHLSRVSQTNGEDLWTPQQGLSPLAGWVLVLHGFILVLLFQNELKAVGPKCLSVLDNAQKNQSTAWAGRDLKDDQQKLLTLLQHTQTS